MEPLIYIAKNPANFTTKYMSAPIFTAKKCNVTKTFGEQNKRVLFVFDGKTPIDINTITATLVTEVKAMMGTLTGGFSTNQVASQMQQFMGSLAASGQIPSRPAGASYGKA